MSERTAARRAEAEVDRLRALNKELVAALRPFAVVRRRDELSLGDFVRASTALDKAEGEHYEENERLRAINAELVAALRTIAETEWEGASEHQRELARAAIAKAKA